jgi:hypothetical protein
MFQKNVGGVDKIIRIIGGLGIFGCGVYFSIWWLYVIGIVVFLTGILSRCGLYTLLGINTNKKCTCVGGVCTCDTGKTEEVKK